MFAAALVRGKIAIGNLVLSSLLLIPAGAAMGQETQNQGLWSGARSTVSSIANSGKWDIYLSGYARHFARPDWNNLNEKAWGGGFGKTFRNAKNNDESLFILITRDSNEKVQYVGGYMHQWIHPLGKSGVEVGVGLTAFIISRQDIFHGTPFPAVLPVASLGTKNAKLMATVAPYKPDDGKRSGVALIFGKYTFN